MKKKHTYTIFFLLLITTTVVVIKSLRLVEYYSFRKSNISLKSCENITDVRLIYSFENDGKNDSLPISLKDGYLKNIPDYYGKQDFVFYLNNYRWYPNIGFVKFKKWYKFKIELSIKENSKENYIVRVDLFHDGIHDKVVDTVSIGNVSN